MTFSLARTPDVKQLEKLDAEIIKAGDSFIDADPVERETLMKRLDQLFDLRREITGGHL